MVSRYLSLAAIALVPLIPTVALADIGELQDDPTNIIILPGAHSSSERAVEVLSVGDGDTLTVTDGEQKTTIRIACIDTPEMKQAPYGERSKQRLLQLAPVGSQVRVEAKDTDRYGRTVAEVFRTDENVGLTLVEEGHAVVYRQYLGSCDGDAYLASEQQARSRSAAFWQQPSPIMPWDYRRGVVTTAAEQQAEEQTKQCDPAYTSHCVPPYSIVGDLNCGDLPFGQIATKPEDPHGLDGDNDGVGCESQ